MLLKSSTKSSSSFRFARFRSVQQWVVSLTVQFIQSQRPFFATPLHWKFGSVLGRRVHSMLLFFETFNRCGSVCQSFNVQPGASSKPMVECKFTVPVSLLTHHHQATNVTTLQRFSEELHKHSVPNSKQLQTANKKTKKNKICRNKQQKQKHSFNILPEFHPVSFSNLFYPSRPFSLKNKIHYSAAITQHPKLPSGPEMRTLPACRCPVPPQQHAPAAQVAHGIPHTPRKRVSLESQIKNMWKVFHE